MTRKEVLELLKELVEKSDVYIPSKSFDETNFAVDHTRLLELIEEKLKEKNVTVSV